MGNRSSRRASSPPPQLGIAFEGADGPVRAGSVLRGVVWAHIQQEIPATGILLQFLGEEYAKFTYSTGSGKNRRTHTAKQAHPIVNQSYDAGSDRIRNGRLASGRYRLPFSISIPEFLPSTSYFQPMRDNAEMRIDYQIKVSLMNGRSLDGFTSCQVPVVSKMHTSPPRPYLAEPFRKDVRFCGCFNRGEIVFGVGVDDSVMARGQSVDVSVSLRNNTSLQINEFKATLKRLIVLKANGKSTYFRTDVKGVGFDVHRMMTAQPSLNMRGDSVRHDRDRVLNEVVTKETMKPLLMPPTSLASYTGCLIHVSYRLCVRLRTQGGCCTDNPIIEIPIQCVDTRMIAESAAVAEAQLISSPPPTAPHHSEIPIASAVPLEFSERSDEVIQAAAVVIDQESSQVAGLIVPNPTAPSAPQLEEATTETTPSKPLLWQQMMNSVADLTIVSRHLEDQRWDAVFASFTPDDVGTTIDNVDFVFDKPAVAELIATKITFTCAHAAAAIRSCSHDRPSMVRAILGHCVDKQTNMGQVTAVLTEWERDVLAEELQ